MALDTWKYFINKNKQNKAKYTTNPHSSGYFVMIHIPFKNP